MCSKVSSTFSLQIFKQAVLLQVINIKVLCFSVHFFISYPYLILQGISSNTHNPAVR